MGVLGLDLRRNGRVALMNQIANVLQIPAGGWRHGQSKLFEGPDVRLVALLQTLAKESKARVIGGNLERAGKFTHVNIMLALVSAAREHHSALTATGAGLINSYDEGGLDFLWDEKEKLGLPHSVTKTWKRVEPFRNEETNNFVHPALIPARDQVMVYAAQLGSSFQLNFKRNVASELGAQADLALARASRIGLLVWQAYAFLAPGGGKFDPTKKLSAQLGQQFGTRTALGYVAQIAQDSKVQPDLNLIYSDAALNHSEWVRSSKTRAAETLFLERLLKQAREVLPH